MNYNMIVTLLGILSLSFILDGVECSITLRNEQLNDLAIKTAKTKYGEIYDCVDIDKQPGLQHPALVDHQVQISPGKKYVDALKEGSYKHENKAKNTIWLEKGCPFGTVPIPRTSQQHLGSDYLNAMAPNQSLEYNGGLEFAGIIVRNGGNGYQGATASLSLHKPAVTDPQFSSASIIIENGVEQIQAGWIVHPRYYGDGNTRFYTTWTKDNYKSIGCFNTDCPGFIIVSQEFPLDFVFQQVSDPKTGQLFDVNVSIGRRDTVGNWWLSVNDIVIGYWPSKLFARLGQSADVVRFGGQVYSLPPSHFSPPMGSGKFKGDNPYRTAYMHLVAVALNDAFVPPPNNLVEKVRARCYFVGWDSYSSNGPLHNYHFLYGGIGGDANSECL